MISRILIALATLVTPSLALAHPGHVADLGHGHTHWVVYAIGAAAVISLLIWAGEKLFANMKSAITKRT